MQRLPIGIQDFEKLRTENFLYVDKTSQIYDLINGAGYYFLSRPRRFGKSLLVSTLKNIFLGKKELFKGLFIEDKIEWNTFPVIHLDFAKSNYIEIGLRAAITERLNYQADLYEITLTSEAVSSKLQELIQKLHKKYNQKVVLLIDEYDKPIINFLDDNKIHIAEENREIMKNLYSCIKILDNELRFFLLTGVSRFSKVSIFSDLNNLQDITLNHLGYTLVGYTESELHHYFKEFITFISQETNQTEEKLKKEIKEWYNGYSFGGEKLYNPSSVLNFMFDREFNNYWFETGTPTFLVKLLRQNQDYNLNEVETNHFSLDNYDIKNIHFITVLFQTGYLTIKEQIEKDRYYLTCPNKEVEKSMIHLLKVYSSSHK